MTWSTALSDLRVQLSDGPIDKLCAFKKVFGIQNGKNRIFKTFEQRRVTDFSSSGTIYPLGVYKNGDVMATSAISADDLTSGYFTVVTDQAPVDSDVWVATYYSQWFTDAELTGFLQRASEWLGFGATYSQISDAFKTAALKYACHEAYQKLAVRAATSTTDGYRLEDTPDEKRTDAIRAYQSAAKAFLDAAFKTRDDVYERGGQAKAPRFGTISGNIKNPTVS